MVAFFILQYNRLTTTNVTRPGMYDTNCLHQYNETLRHTFSQTHTKQIYKLNRRRCWLALGDTSKNPRNLGCNFWYQIQVRTREILEKNRENDKDFVLNKSWLDVLSIKVIILLSKNWTYFFVRRIKFN